MRCAYLNVTVEAFNMPVLIELLERSGVQIVGGAENVLPGSVRLKIAGDCLPDECEADDADPRVVNLWFRTEEHDGVRTHFVDRFDVAA